jgi:outer membrane protein TolC
LLRAEVAVANLRPDVINAEDTHVLAMNNLKIAMGIPFSEEIAVDGSLEFHAVPDSIPAMATDLVLDANPSISALRLQADVNRAIVSAQWSEYLPTLSAFGNYQLQAQKNDFRFSTNNFVGSILVGLTLSVNIFNGLQTNARVEQARIDVRKTEEQISGLEKNLRTLTQSLTQRLQRARERVAAQLKTVEQAERGYRIATTRFLSGSGTQLEVNDAQLALTRSKVNRIQAVYDYLVAATELDQVLGRVPEYVKGEEE